jgi:hypothetical protein
MSSRPAFYSQNENQNYFVHEGKTSSRVLQAPGGKSSINLCWDNHIDDDGKTHQVDNIFKTCFYKTNKLLTFSSFHQ